MFLLDGCGTDRNFLQYIHLCMEIKLFFVSCWKHKITGSKSWQVIVETTQDILRQLLYTFAVQIYTLNQRKVLQNSLKIYDFTSQQRTSFKAGSFNYFFIFYLKMLPISDLRNHPGIYAVEVRHVCPCGEMELMPASFAL